jgi:hypothetical protein
VAALEDKRDLELHRRVTLVDLADRLLDKGVVIAGDITLSVADVDLVYISLRALVASVETAMGAGDHRIDQGATQKVASE